MNVLCLDLEGVLIPEIWQEVAHQTGVEQLKLTTRDIADYDELMSLRLRLLDENGITLSKIQRTLESMRPLVGAAEFLQWARERFQVAILSDTFYEFASVLMKQLTNPFLLCHHLVIENDVIQGYRLRQDDPKRRAVEAFQSLQLQVIAVGDSYNDLGMLDQANKGFLFSAPPNLVSDYPSLEFIGGYDALIERLKEFC